MLASSALGFLGVLPRIMAWIALAIGAHLVGMFLIAADTMDATTTVVLFMLFLVAVAPRRSHYRIGRPLRPLDMSEQHHGPMFLLMAFMVAYYFFSGINKVLDIGIQWMFQASLDVFSVAAIEKSIFPTSGMTSLFVSDLLSHPAIGLICAILVFTLELAAPVVLVFPRLIVPFFLFFIAMHTAIYLSHGYGYWSNIGADLVLVFYGLMSARIRSWLTAGTASA